MSTPTRHILVVIPTYDEAENLPRIVERVHEHAPQADVLVVDDASPDGTGEIADRLAADDDRVHVLHRDAKTGLGAAYLAGFSWALDHGYGLVVEMDADGSHPAERLPALLAAADPDSAAPVAAIGSRWVAGGRVVDWPLHRELLSRGANAYARLLLGLGVRDATAGFRAYPAAALRRMQLAEVDSHGYCFQVDLTLRAIEAGVGIVEVPIEFHDREHGVSKMSGADVFEAIGRVTLWAFTRRPSGSARRSRRAGRAAVRA